jgi:hypothetical protein
MAVVYDIYTKGKGEIEHLSQMVEGHLSRFFIYKTLRIMGIIIPAF